jgi:hypothetical protein
MWTIGLTYGLAPQTLAAASPDVLVDEPRELPLVLSPAPATLTAEPNGETTPPSPS